MSERATTGQDPVSAVWETAVIVGLGNPGLDYAGNRHNVGAMVVAEMVAEQGIKLKRGSGRLARVVSSNGRLAARRVTWATLTTYMNDSGQAVRALLDYYKAPPDRLIVLHDELDLPFGAVRIKAGGGNNGHNGLRSITQSLRTPGYVRVRIGIGRPLGRQSPADFVLSDFSASERRQLPELLAHAAQAVSLLVQRGITAAQNDVHRPPRAVTYGDENLARHPDDN